MTLTLFVGYIIYIHREGNDMTNKTPLQQAVQNVSTDFYLWALNEAKQAPEGQQAATLAELLIGESDRIQGR